MSNGIVPFSSLPSCFSQHKLCGGIVWIGLQFLVQFLFCVLYVGRICRKKKPSQTVVNSAPLRILLKNLSVFRCSLVQITLRLERFCLKLLGLRGSRGRSCQFLRRPRSQV